MIRLNLDEQKNLYPASKPMVKVMDIHGKRIGYDVNSMDVYLLDKKEKPPTPYDYEPQFGVNPTGKAIAIVLSVTSGCNASCAYCYHRNYRPKTKAKVMTWDIAKRTIEMVDFHRSVQANIPVSVSFFGGEPLLAFDLVEKSTKYVESLAKEAAARFSVGITTNGTLMTPEICDFLAAHHFSMIYSIDGKEDIHNQQRPLKNGENAFEATMRGLELIKKSTGLGGVTLRGSFTGKGADLVEQVAFLNDLCDQGYADNVSYEPISLSEASCVTNAFETGVAITMKNIEQFRDPLHDVAKWIVERLRAGRQARMSLFMIFIRRLAMQQPNATDCGAGNGYITANAEGNIFACHHEGDCKIGDVWNGIHEPSRAKWLDNRLYLRKHCMSCWLRWACGGGCRMNAVDAGKDMHAKTDIDCWFREVLIKESLWIMSELTPREVKQFIHVGMRRPPAQGAVKGCDCNGIRT